MTDLHYKIILNNNIEYVFDKLFSHPEYQEWTSAFNPNSDYKGTLAKGEELFFFDADNNGMSCQVSEYQVNKLIEFTYIAQVIDGKPIPFDDNSNFERYTFTSLSHEMMMLDIHLRLPQEWAEMMESMWAKAIGSIHEIFDNDDLLE